MKKIPNNTNNFNTKNNFFNQKKEINEGKVLIEHKGHRFYVAATGSLSTEFSTELVEEKNYEPFSAFNRQ